jgi:hypothetical protein
MMSSRDSSVEGSHGFRRPDSSEPPGSPQRALCSITVLNQQHFRRIDLLVDDHRDGPSGPARGEELAQKACQPGWKMFPHCQRGPVKKGVSFNEVCKPRKQLCSPPLNLDTAPVYVSKLSRDALRTVGLTPVPSRAIRARAAPTRIAAGSSGHQDGTVV